MKPIIIDNAKDLAIIILSLIIFLKILIVFAYYKGVHDTRNTINSALNSDLNSYKKFNS